MKKLKWILCCICLLGTFSAQAEAKEKEILIPSKQKKEQEFGKRFDYKHMAESDNLVLFWEKSFGDAPASLPDENRRFYPDEILEEGERFYNYYVDKLKFADREKSFSARYKMIIWMIDDDVRTAYGWGDEGVGMMWFRPCRIQSYPYCPLAHEMGHSFQYMTGADGARSFHSTPIVEYSSQWMLWQVYPDWTTIEKYHLDAYMDQTHLSLLHVDNQYHAPQFMEYWSNKHGADIIGRIWREAKDKEDPVATYQRLTGMNQEQFNDEIYDAASHFVTWDMPRVKQVCRTYANQHTCKVEKADADGWYKIAQTRCPQDYGYNAIRLTVPRGGDSISIEFQGLAGDTTFVSKHPGEAGWRYGFVASDHNGYTHYGEMQKAVNGKNPPVTYRVPEQTQYLWLVVTAAPTVHHGYWKFYGQLEKEKGNEPQWPYQIRLNGVKPDASVLKAKK